MLKLVWDYLRFHYESEYIKGTFFSSLPLIYSDIHVIMNIYFLSKRRCKVHSTYPFSSYQRKGVKNTKSCSLLKVLLSKG